MNSLPGQFLISLDFELHWGCFEKMILNEAEQLYFRNTRKIIEEKLELFSSNDIHVTWAAVGMLFNKDISEWKKNVPPLIPTFDKSEVSAYKWIEKHGFYSDEDPYHFAPDLVAKIKATPCQEIGTHTYAHYFCLESGQNKLQFREDLIAAKKIAASKNIDLKSLVFPRNQFNPAYLSVCYELGITAVRSSPDIWYWSPATGSSFMKKFFRAGDAYLKFQPIKTVYLKDIKSKPGSPLLLPASRLYRPWQQKYSIQNSFKLRRILNEMTSAAKNGAYYHIWWHPHNFGNFPRQCMAELEQIISHYVSLRNKYGFQSLTMNEVTKIKLRI